MNRHGILILCHHEVEASRGQLVRKTQTASLVPGITSYCHAGSLRPHNAAKTCVTKYLPALQTLCGRICFLVTTMTTTTALQSLLCTPLQPQTVWVQVRSAHGPVRGAAARRARRGRPARRPPAARPGAARAPRARAAAAPGPRARPPASRPGPRARSPPGAPPAPRPT